jgi:hypothetical protein
MEDKEAIEILMKLLEKDSLSKEEKEAIRLAIGILSWSKLAEGRIKSIAKAQKAKREKDNFGISN